MNLQELIALSEDPYEIDRLTEELLHHETERGYLVSDYRANDQVWYNPFDKTHDRELIQ